ncbi:MAG TPA: molybdenum cofactor guanylyltransferase [Thermoanaerobaculia bacterium]|nr:molybdenum cofactor guanylyltransferase [Thermoanaerobaculia bacterium]
MNCYILTGGRSARMGRSKAALFLGTISAAAAPAFERIIAVQRHGTETLSIETIFEESHEHEAPVFGVVRALQDCGGRCFVLATDYPLITTDFLRDLRSRFEASEAPVLMPVWQGVPQPLCAGYSSGILDTLQRRIAENRLDLRGLASEVPTVLVDVEGHALVNVNTPAELEEAERLR